MCCHTLFVSCADKLCILTNASPESICCTPPCLVTPISALSILPDSVHPSISLTYCSFPHGVLLIGLRVLTQIFSLMACLVVVKHFDVFVLYICVLCHKLYITSAINCNISFFLCSSPFFRCCTHFLFST